MCLLSGLFPAGRVDSSRGPLAPPVIKLCPGGPVFLQLILRVLLTWLPGVGGCPWTRLSSSLFSSRLLNICSGNLASSMCCSVKPIEGRASNSKKQLGSFHTSQGHLLLPRFPESSSEVFGPQSQLTILIKQYLVSPLTAVPGTCHSLETQFGL